MTLPAPVVAAAHAGLAKKADEVVALDLRSSADFTDFFLLLSGQNQRQLVAIADAVLDALRATRAPPGPRRGLPPAGVDPARLLELRRPRHDPPHARLLRPRAAVGRGEAGGGRGVTTAPRDALAGVVAESRAMRELLPLVLRLAETRSPVLLQGESGTGKDLVAHWLHYGGPRREGPFIKVHCPSIPGELLESELFGHEKGAFTDARHAKAGKIEIAAGGTLYFDQVQDLVPPLQAKLLRVIEERRFERVGGTRTLEVDVRFVASANVDLAEAVQTGRFREDLFHRLNVVPLRLEPLRNRREDVLPLAEAFLARERERGATAASGFAPETVGVLKGYLWPGNVRELRSVVERCALVVPSGEVPPAALPPQIVEQPSTLWAGRDRRPTLKDVEQAYIRWVLDAVGGSQTRAAAVLGISRKALWEKRRRYGIG